MSEGEKISCPVPVGKLLIIGGAENKGEGEVKEKQKPADFERLQILKTFIALTQKENPVVEVVTSASSKGSEVFDDYKKAFDQLSIKQLGHIHHETRQEALEDETLLQRVQLADAIFFAGGDQLQYTYKYGGTPFITALKQKYIYQDVVVAGTSAGAMALSTPMIYAGNNEVQELGGMIKVTTGLEFLKDVCIDTHFVNRGRFIRMAQVIVTNPTSIGIGIEEDTAIVVSNGIDVQVVGTGTIIILEGENISEANISEFTSNKPITIRNLKTHILSDGDTYIIPQSNPAHI